MTWRVCDSCGYSKALDPGEHVCPSCVARGCNIPEPATIVEYDFGPPARSLDGGAALNAVERDAWLALERSLSDLIDVEFRHLEDPS